LNDGTPRAWRRYLNADRLATMMHPPTATRHDGTRVKAETLLASPSRDRRGALDRALSRHAPLTMREVP
jgi:hypothetical protein